MLDNGITLIVVENQAADIISGRFFFKGVGTIVEKIEQAGLAHLVAAVITKGTENLSALEIAEKIESTKVDRHQYENHYSSLLKTEKTIRNQQT